MNIAGQSLSWIAGRRDREYKLLGWRVSGGFFIFFKFFFIRMV